MSRSLPPALTTVVLLAILTACASPGVTPSTMESVVSVLPVWPQGPGTPDHVRKARREQPEGSGVAVLPGGYIATNLHVVRDASRIRVRLADGRVLPVTVVGRDASTDLALLKAPFDLPVLSPADPPTLAQRVCAIGNQFGLGLSVTCGVVSAVHRTGTGFNPIEDFVQTDAAINPGASGGALIDGSGRLVGLVSAIFSKSTDSNIGVNFATSTALVLKVAEDLRAHGHVTRAAIGVRAAELPPEGRTAGVGVQVVDTVPDGPADKAGIRTGDIITAIDGRRIETPADLTAAIALRRPGDTATVALRRDGTGRRLQVTLEVKTTP